MNKVFADQFNLQEACDFAVTRIVEQGGQCKRGDRFVFGDGQGNFSPSGMLMDRDNSMLMNAEGGLDTLIDDFDLSIFLPNILKQNISVFCTLDKFHDCNEKESRESIKSVLEDVYGINTKNPYWNKWVNMGAAA